MITYSGQMVMPGDEDMHGYGTPTLEDIAVGLSRMVRFAGQTKLYYTVLAHTFTVADLVAPEHKIYALLHDAPEAVVADVPTTWKTSAAKAHEADLLERISESLGIVWPWPEESRQAVKAADLAALYAEAHVLGHSDTSWCAEPDPHAMLLTRTRRFYCDQMVNDPPRAVSLYRRAWEAAKEAIESSHA